MTFHRGHCSKLLIPFLLGFYVMSFYGNLDKFMMTLCANRSATPSAEILVLRIELLSCRSTFATRSTSSPHSSDPADNFLYVLTTSLEIVRQM